MRPELLSNFPPRELAGDAAQLFTYLQTIRVLIYTDDPEKVQDKPDIGFHIGLLKRFQNANQPSFAKVEFELLSRNELDAQGKLTEEGHAKIKLTGPLLSSYDQVWVFGLHLSNLKEVSWPNIFFLRGGPRSELTPDEVKALGDWMGSEPQAGGRMGGVLVTGDHSERKSPNATPDDLPNTLSLGRALSHLVPRAGELRLWLEGPTTEAGKSINTLARGGCPPNTSNAEGDVTPQSIILPSVAGDCPHPIFIGKGGKEIDIFPDHGHEGELLTPKTTGGDWPAGSPDPVVAALGADKRNGNVHKLVVTYDGDTVNVGRIAADSTWHHYFNDNLIGFKGEAEEGTVANRLGQFYTNLALWLTPLPKRQAITRSMFWWLANQPQLIEVAGSDTGVTREKALRLGIPAGELLSQVASPTEIHEMLNAYSPAGLRAKVGELFYPASESALSALSSRAMILGAVLNRYYQEFRSPSPAPPPEAPLEGQASALIRAGFKDAFELHVQHLAAVRDMALVNSREV